MNQAGHRDQNKVRWPCLPTGLPQPSSSILEPDTRSLTQSAMAGISHNNQVITSTALGMRKSNEPARKNENLRSRLSRAKRCLLWQRTTQLQQAPTANSSEPYPG